MDRNKSAALTGALEAQRLFDHHQLRTTRLMHELTLDLQDAGTALRVGLRRVACPRAEDLVREGDTTAGETENGIHVGYTDRAELHEIWCEVTARASPGQYAAVAPALPTTLRRLQHDASARTCAACHAVLAYEIGPEGWEQAAYTALAADVCPVCRDYAQSRRRGRAPSPDLEQAAEVLSAVALAAMAVTSMPPVPPS